jgi:pimeloyl-ACP methyl ester carboxylesterase
MTLPRWDQKERAVRRGSVVALPINAAYIRGASAATTNPGQHMTTEREPTKSVAGALPLGYHAVHEEFATVGAVKLCYSTTGDPERPALLLIMGLGYQLVHWPDAFCQQLADRGYYVVRFDNRDAGRSTHLPGARYTLEDMADDAVGLLDAQRIGSAHVVGASLGGMVAQLMAIRHPTRVRSLASLMSTTGQRGKGKTALRLYRHAFSRRPRTEEEAVARRVRIFLDIGSTGFSQDADEIRRATMLAFRRDPDSRGGRRRQHRAARTSDDRTARLRQISAPTIVIHGTADPICHASGGEATAQAIPGARLELIDGMGHDFPPDAWPRVIGAIADNARRADATPRTSKNPADPGG